MKIKSLTPLLFILILGLGAQSIPDAVTNVQAEKDLRSAWAKKYKGEKIISIESAGEPAILEKVDANDKVVERKLKVPFTVVAEKSGTKREYEAGSNYVQKGKKWLFSEIGVGNVSVLAGEGEKAPNKADVKALVITAFQEKYPDYTWSKVLIDDGTFGKGENGGFYRYEGDIDRTDADGAKVQCKDIDFMLQKDASGSWAVDITSQGRCY